MTTNILVTFSSTYDHVHQMALAVAEGAERGRALPAGRGHEGTPPNSAGLVSTLREFAHWKAPDSCACHTLPRCGSAPSDRPAPSPCPRRRPPPPAGR